MSKTGIMPIFTGVLLACCVGLQSAEAAEVNAQQHPAPLATRAAELAANFASPPASAKTGVFWFWVNGNITREGITADLEAMARVGIGRAVIFEVSGDIPGGPVMFLSDAWRALFRHALSEAARLGIALNINNDAGWCGSGGPWNTPENSMQKLVSTRTRVEVGKPFDAVLPQPPAVKGFYMDILVLATKTVPAGDDSKRIWPRSQAVDLTSRMEASGRLRWDPPAGTWEILRIGHTSTGKDNHPAPASGTGPECDKLSKRAVKAHFDGMMAKLIADAGPLAGRTLEYTHIDSWEVGTQNWTPAFREEFQRRRGYDPLPFLPGELGYILDDPETQRRFQWDMRVTVSDLILENYAGYFRSLAAEHGLTLSIEAYGAHPGHCPVNNLSYAGRADLPIGEFWVGQNNYRSCKEMACASHVYGKRLTGAEAFTAWPDNARFQFHPGNIKAMGDRCFCAGVNRLMLHCYTHQPWLDRAPGMTMQGWGTHFERTQTWWEQSKAWHTYIARCQHLLQSGLFAADVCYLDVEDAPRDAPYPIILPGYDYDVCPAEVVKSRMSVKDGRITLPDGMSYRLLVLPHSETMTPETLRRVVELAKGGAVIAATHIPSRSPSLRNYPACDAEVKALARELFGDQAAVPAASLREVKCGAGRVFLGGDVPQVLAALSVPPDVSITGGGEDKRISWIHRRTDDADFYFVSNQLAREEEISCTFRDSQGQPELWHPETGTISALPVHQTTADGRIEVPLKFEPEEAFFVVFRKESQEPTADGARKPGRNWREFTPAQTLDGAWKVTFDPKWGGPEKPVVFDALTDWSRHATEGIKFYSGTAVYQKTFAVDSSVAGLPSVFLDLGQVEVMADVKLNGKDLGTLWKKPFRIDVTGHLKPGDNQLEVRVVNLWCNRLIGDEHLPEDAEWKDGFMGWGGQFDVINQWPQWLLDGKPSPSGRFTFTTASYYKKDDALKPSGLLGPVRLLTPVGNCVGAEAETHGASTYDGKFCAGEGDMDFLRLIDESFAFFNPNPIVPNLTMVYKPEWDTLVEAGGWNAWWIQNSYGFSYAATPFLQQPWFTLLQRSWDLFWNLQGDGKRVGHPNFPLVAPDGCLGDCASPAGIVYKQGDGDWKNVHDWFHEATAAGVVMQAEILLTSRDRKALAYYLPKMARACDSIERTRDPKNNLFLVGPASNLLAPSYGGVRQPDGSFGPGYLAGLSVTYLAALDRMVELYKLAGDGEKHAEYERRQKITRESLPMLLAPAGYFVKSVEPGGVKHGVLGQKEFGYLEGTVNADAVALRVADDKTSESIYKQIAAFPEIRPFDFLLTNAPGLDDTYWNWGNRTGPGFEGFHAFGDWVNGGAWSTVEGRAILMYYRLGKFEDIRRSATRAMKWSKDYRLDSPWSQRGENTDNWWYDEGKWLHGNGIKVTVDNYAIPAATIRGLFDYDYRSDRLILRPRVPGGIARYVQKLPVRFGEKRLYLSCRNGGPRVKSVTVNGKKINVESPEEAVLPYDTLPSEAKVELTTVGGWPKEAASVAYAAIPALVPDSGRSVEAPAEWPESLKKPFAVLSGLEKRIADEPGADYERAFVSVALSSFEDFRVRAAMEPGPGYFRPITPKRRAALTEFYEKTALGMYNGLVGRMKVYGEKGDARQKRLAVLFAEATAGAM